MKFDMLFKAINYVNEMKIIYYPLIFINKDNQNRYYITSKMSNETVYNIYNPNKPTIKQIRKEKVKKILR